MTALQKKLKQGLHRISIKNKIELTFHWGGSGEDGLH